MTNPDKLPDDIAAAIRQLESCAWIDGNVETEGTSQGRKIARAALDAAILARLTAAAAAAGAAVRELETERLLHQVSCDGRKRDVRGLEDAIEAEAEERRGAERERNAILARVERLETALRPFADVCDAEHMKHVRDEQVLELATRAEVTVSEKLRGRDFRAARAALADNSAG